MTTPGVQGLPVLACLMSSWSLADVVSSCGCSPVEVHDIAISHSRLLRQLRPKTPINDAPVCSDSLSMADRALHKSPATFLEADERDLVIEQLIGELRRVNQQLAALEHASVNDGAVSHRA
jgi:hypothetical protein